jgi:hypothetical protein
MGDKIQLPASVRSNTSPRMSVRYLQHVTKSKFPIKPGQGRFQVTVTLKIPPLRYNGHSSWLQARRSRVQFAQLPDFLSSNGSGTGSTQSREDR